MEEPVTFTNKNGRKLFGIVHIPEKLLDDGSKIGINVLNPGIKYRVAPHRLNVKLARELCRNGYCVLRFDPEGIGDSEGELPEGIPLADLWGSIQSGQFVSDCIAANDFFMRTYGLSRLILVGNCGGAITSLITSARDHRISGLCLGDTPVYLWNSSRSFVEKVTDGGEKLDRYFSEYSKRLLSLKAWYRFFTFQTDFKGLKRVLWMKLKHKTGFLCKEIPCSDVDLLCREKGLNRLFFTSFDSFAGSGKPILFILAENDPGRDTFQTYFQSWYLDQKHSIPTYRNQLEIFVIADSNHIYSFTESQQAYINKICSWVNTHCMEVPVR